mmetsp:Transcript_37596/g.88874  ORF Transcript_37596/g.88874 Transcript_37596/m.88874 type:complete len:232 (+) Transcript_37596:403-1098(+)
MRADIVDDAICVPRSKEVLELLIHRKLQCTEWKVPRDQPKVALVESPRASSRKDSAQSVCVCLVQPGLRLLLHDFARRQHQRSHQIAEHCCRKIQSQLRSSRKLLDQSSLGCLVGAEHNHPVRDLGADCRAVPREVRRFKHAVHPVGRSHLEARFHGVDWKHRQGCSAASEASDDNMLLPCQRCDRGRGGLACSNSCSSDGLGGGRTNADSGGGSAGGGSQRIIAERNRDA